MIDRDHATPRASQTVACVLTGGGRSAVAVVAIAGEKAKAIVDRYFDPAFRRTFRPGQVRYGQWVGQDDSAVATESVVITPLDDSSFEVHCHGGVAATRRIMDDLAVAGALAIEPNQWVCGRMPPLIAEATAVLAGCVTARTAAIAMDQVRGALQGWATTSFDGLQQSPVSAHDVRLQAADILRSAVVTARLTVPFRVVLVGPPNVGKSSLVNAIVGYDRSITMDVAGTTRDVLHADTVIDGLPIRISDTAGIRVSDEPIEREGIKRARGAAVDADLVVRVVQPGIPPLDDVVHAATIDVMNKMDTLASDSCVDQSVVGTIATTGQGIELLMDRIVSVLTQAMPSPGAAAAINRRQAWLIRAIAESDDAVAQTMLLQELLTPTSDHESQFDE
ncbi:tRNA modification GTPase MnmE [Rubripirellula tenax]|uniref:tRNA modification GTPase MnmE n=1 Tax=Rubripirellula tenax TaxID=2528015 RepID=A0A5C6F5T7_9BACT|nr:GTPase [Rubripirellula tenax]TWU56595.1 tRNA modification GTPase MnmE [Rubripirellula tenax]